jgi:hypothetical protein
VTLVAMEEQGDLADAHNKKFYVELQRDDLSFKYLSHYAIIHAASVVEGNREYLLADAETQQLLHDSKINCLDVACFIECKGPRGELSARDYYELLAELKAAEGCSLECLII